MYSQLYAIHIWMSAGARRCQVPGARVQDNWGAAWWGAGPDSSITCCFCPLECLPSPCLSCSCPEQSPTWRVLSGVNKLNCFSSNFFFCCRNLSQPWIYKMKKNFFPIILIIFNDKDKPVEQRVRKIKTSFAADHCGLFTQLLQAAAAVKTKSHLQTLGFNKSFL